MGYRPTIIATAHFPSPNQLTKQSNTTRSDVIKGINQEHTWRVLLIYRSSIVSVLKSGSSAQWPQLGKLLEEGRYARLAEHLLELQTSIEETNHPDLKNLSIAALQICVLCQQCQLEIEWHRRANQEVQKRAHELDGQLRSLLKLIIEYESLKNDGLPPISVTVSALTDGETPEVSEHPTIWQRIQQLFNYEPEPPTPIPQQSSVVIDALFTELAENEEHLANLDDEDDSEPVTASIVEDDEIATFAAEEAKLVEESTAPAKPESRHELKDVAGVSMEVSAPTRETQPSLTVYCLGPFRVYQNDQLITEWQSLKSQAVFKYLLSNSEVPIQKNVLMDLFWPDATPEAARRNLHQAIYSLRKLLRGDKKDFQHILFENDHYSLNPGLDIWLDFKEFEGHVKTGHRLESAGHLEDAIKQYGTAEGLYRGEFLEEDLYEDWIRQLRRHYLNMYMDSTDRLSRYYLHQGEYIATIALCRKLLIKDTCHEGAHRRLMQCYLSQGQVHLAVRQYQSCVRALSEELDIAPSPETVKLYQHITNNR